MTPEEIRRRTFVLDTKSSCFLCLQEIEIPSGGEGNNDGNGDTDIRDDKERFSLRSILLYLKLNPRNVFSCLLGKKSSSSLISDSAKLLEKITNFSVSLCQECRQVSKQLSEACKELELIQFKVEHYLESFFELLALSQSDEDQVKYFLGKMTGTLYSVQGSIADILRSQTVAKCRQVLNQAQPRVCLRQANQDKQFIFPAAPAMFSESLSSEPASELQPVIISTKTLSQNTKSPGRRLETSLSSSSLNSGLQLPLPLHPKSSFPTEPSVSLCDQVCDPCGGKFPSKEEWINHLKMNCFLSGAPMRKSPTSCNMSFYKGIKRPRLMPKGPKPMPELDSTIHLSSLHLLVQCKTCRTTFLSPKDLLRHQILVHSPGTTHKSEAQIINIIDNESNGLVHQAQVPVKNSTVSEQRHNTLGSRKIFSSFGASAETKFELVNSDDQSHLEEFIQDEEEIIQKCAPDYVDIDLLTTTNKSMMIIVPDRDPLQL